MKDKFFLWSEPAAHLLVSGPDAPGFLQGQFSNELRAPAPRRSVYGLWLNHKGRVLADSHVLVREDGRFDIVSVASAAGVIRERLEAFIIADDVAVEDATDGAGLGVIGGAAGPAVLGDLGLELPGVGAFAAGGGLFAVRSRSAGRAEAWHVLAPAGEAPAARDRFLAAAVRAGAEEVAENELAAARIAFGVPAVPAELGPGDLPNEGGLEHEAISYTKGCYLGQEVMARLHNLGQVRRRLHVVLWDGAGDAPALPAPLFRGDRAAGELRRLVRDGEGRNIGLAMVPTQVAKPGDRLSTEPGGAPDVELLRIAEGRAW